MCRLLPPVALLLLTSADTRAADLPKAVVSLDPKWDRLLEKDNVTLQCRGAYPKEDNSTRWLHNGKPLPGQSSTYVIADARVKDSGNYSCQTASFTLSDPVQLKVHADWLVLQAARWVLQEGEPLQLRCHSWKNIRVGKVQYFRNGRGQQFSHKNSEFHIQYTKRAHSGSYFCRGIIGKQNVSSEAVNVTVQGVAVPAVSPFLLLWQMAFCLVMGLLFAVDTRLYFSVQKELRSSLRKKRNDKVTCGKNP
ncbi:low affinity immunoglobulin gamma Fc region receptor III-A isoform X1 [Rhinolophus sinicus]|uniref:low affinity immunoglobulin gamma Fc region receptor III-A isoform X1 n=1 Tax=Rhinolophus sinicus TaxID=89399 RepID=UPI003D79EAAD